MAIDKHISRLSKIIAEREGITFPDAEAKLKSLTLEIVIGKGADTPAGQTAILTAVNLAHRTFVGGVRLSGEVHTGLCSTLPVQGSTIGEAAFRIGAKGFDGAARESIAIGKFPWPATPSAILVDWNTWSASASRHAGTTKMEGSNPLAGIAAAALGVGLAFYSAFDWPSEDFLQVELWSGGEAPKFEDVYLPNAAWLIGLGNLGQAYLWALSALPYNDPTQVTLFLQDKDTVKEENWATSALVFDDFKQLKTKLCEDWASSKGFNVHRVDRFFVGSEIILPDEPQLALSGLDSTEARKLIDQSNFQCILDAGLGAGTGDFDRLRVNTFDALHTITDHFKDVANSSADNPLHRSPAYEDLQTKIGECGTAEIAGASAAVPYVSALAAALAVTNLIAVASGQEHACSQSGKVSIFSNFRRTAIKKLRVRGIGHAGRPKV